MALFRPCSQGAIAYCILSWYNLIFIGITFPLYIMVLIVLIKYRKTDDLKHAFFKLMISLGPADLIFMLDTFFFYRAAYIYGWYSDFLLWGGTVLSRMNSILIDMSLMSQKLGCLFIAINRYTALVTPMKHGKIWRKRGLLSGMITCQWLISIVHILPKFAIGYEVHDSDPNVTNNPLYLWWSNTTALLISMILAATIDLLLLPTIITLYAIVFFKTYKNSKKVHSGAMQANQIKRRKVAIKLAVCGYSFTLFIIVGTIAIVVESVFHFVFHITLTAEIGFVHAVFVDLFAGINPWSLLYMSTPVREKFCELYLRKKPVPITKSKQVKQKTDNMKTSHK